MTMLKTKQNTNSIFRHSVSLPNLSIQHWKYIIKFGFLNTAANFYWFSYIPANSDVSKYFSLWVIRNAAVLKVTDIEVWQAVIHVSVQCLVFTLSISIYQLWNKVWCPSDNECLKRFYISNYANQVDFINWSNYTKTIYIYKLGLSIRSGVWQLTGS